MLLRLFGKGLNANMKRITNINAKRIENRPNETIISSVEFLKTSFKKLFLARFHKI